METTGSFINMEGRIQQTICTLKPHIGSRSNSIILNMLSIFLQKHVSPYMNTRTMHNRLVECIPYYTHKCCIETAFAVVNAKNRFRNYLFVNTTLHSIYTNYYMTNTVTDVSENMHACTTFLNPNIYKTICN